MRDSRACPCAGSIHGLSRPSYRALARGEIARSVPARARVVVLAPFRLRPGLGGIRRAAGLLGPGLLRPRLLDARLFHPRLLHARLLTRLFDMALTLNRPFTLFRLALSRAADFVHLALRPLGFLPITFARLA